MTWRRWGSCWLMTMALTMGSLGCNAGSEGDDGTLPEPDTGVVEPSDGSEGDGGTLPEPDPGTVVEPPEPSAELRAIEAELQESAELSYEELLERYPTGLGTGLSYDPSQAAGLELIQASSVALGDEEMQGLTENGFVISRQTRFPSFVYGYETLYLEDLPLYISADSILHALHRSYDEILKETEIRALIPELRTLLESMRQRLADGGGVKHGADARADADFYLAVGLSLLTGEAAAPVAGADAAEIATFVDKAGDATGAEEIEIFGVPRRIDFSQFEPRGHYTDHRPLEQYFRAMIWFGRIDMRILEPDEQGVLHFHRDQLMIAMLMRELMTQPDVERWAAIHGTIGAFVGEPDHMVLPEIDALLADLGIGGGDQLASRSDQEIVAAIEAGGYGTQRISSHYMVNGLGQGTMPLSSSFLLFGQRYVLDSHVFSNVVYDRVQGGGQYRMMPDPLDVAFAALGNNGAAPLLEGELREYAYSPDLHAMRFLADAHGEDFWEANLYNLWLGAIRTLSPKPEVAADWANQGLAEVAATEAWNRRILNTQLASWAELRHDTILYTKQSYTGGAACEFPDAYVDPYPEFYEAIARFAERGATMLDVLPNELAERVGPYFAHLASVATMLAEMARHQRSGTPFTEEQMAFVNQAVSLTHGCDGPEGATGWYPELFLNSSLGLEYDPTIADVHTQPTDEVGAEVGRVLHVGTGMPRLMVVTVETCNGPRAYAGLASSYYEVVEEDWERLTDEEWASELQAGAPGDPEWLDEVARP